MVHQPDRRKAQEADRSNVITRLTVGDTHFRSVHVTAYEPPAQGLRQQTGPARCLTWHRPESPSLASYPTAGKAPGGRCPGQACAEAQGDTRDLSAIQTWSFVPLIHRLPAWSRSFTKRQIQRPKVFLTDTGLNAALSNMDAALSSMQGADHLGPLPEQFVVCELLRQQGWSATPF